VAFYQSLYDFNIPIDGCQMQGIQTLPVLVMKRYTCLRRNYCDTAILAIGVLVFRDNISAVLQQKDGHVCSMVGHGFEQRGVATPIA
jgi:hypothetical protein